MEQDILQAVERAKQGDKPSFALLVTRFQGSVYRHAFAMMNDGSEAEDIAQEAFIKAYISLPKLESGFAFSKWLTKIVSNLCYDRLKSNHREQWADLKQAENIAAADPYETGQTRMEIREAMNNLSPEHREAILLRDVEGYSYEEISQILEIPIGTVKSRINHGRHFMREQLKEERKG